MDPNQQSQSNPQPPQEPSNQQFDYTSSNQTLTQEQASQPTSPNIPNQPPINQIPTSNSQKPPTNKKKMIIILAGAIVLVVIVAAILLILLTSSSPDDKSVHKKASTISSNSKIISTTTPITDVTVSRPASNGFTVKTKDKKDLTNKTYHRATMVIDGDISSYKGRDVQFNWSKPDSNKSFSLNKALSKQKQQTPSTKVSNGGVVKLKDQLGNFYTLPCKDLSYYLTKDSVKINYWGKLCGKLLNNNQYFEMQTFVIGLDKSVLEKLVNRFIDSTTIELSSE